MGAHLRPWEYFKPEKGRHQPPTLLLNSCHQFPCCRSSQPAFSPNAHTVCSAKMLLRHSKKPLQTTSHLHHWQFQLWTEKVVGCIIENCFSQLLLIHYNPPQWNSTSCPQCHCPWGQETDLRAHTRSKQIVTGTQDDSESATKHEK